VTTETTPPKMSVARKYARVAFGTVVAIVAISAGVVAFTGSALPVLHANYKCVPGALIPQLKPGKSATMKASYGGFTATYGSTMPDSTPANTLDVGMPFKGTLKVTRGGESWTLPRPANARDAQINALCVIAFQREHNPGVMVEGFTGGAHCCEVPVIYLFNKATNRYVKVVDMTPDHFKDPHAFNYNEGFIPKVVVNHVLLVTGNDQFSYAFGCYACSTDPIVLDAVGPNGLTDVTPQHPSLVAADASSIWKIAQKALKLELPASASSPFSEAYSPFGFLAPWVADECVLGKGATAWSTIKQIQREGKLSNSLYYLATLDRGSFVAHLHAFLLQNDYCTGQI
jgi:hypothetical protein